MKYFTTLAVAIGFGIAFASPAFADEEAVATEPDHGATAVEESNAESGISLFTRSTARALSLASRILGVEDLVAAEDAYALDCNCTGPLATMESMCALPDQAACAAASADYHSCVATMANVPACKYEIMQ